MSRRIVSLFVCDDSKWIGPKRYGPHGLEGIEAVCKKTR